MSRFLRAAPAGPAGAVAAVVCATVMLAALPFGLAQARAIGAGAAQQPAVLAQAGGPGPVAIIVLDVNHSPPPSRLATEKQEALTYAGALAANVRVGLITFSDGWQTVLAPTLNRTSLQAKINALSYAGFTSNGIGAALQGAVTELGKLGASARARLFLLSDGELLRQPVAAVSVPVDVVGMVSDHQDDYLRTVRQIAAASGGRQVDQAHVASLASLPPLVTARPHPTATAAPRAAAPAWRLTGSLDVVLGLVFLAMLYFAVLVLRSLRRGGRPQAIRQIERYGPRSEAKAAHAQQDEGKLASSAVSLMSRVLSTGNAEPKLAQRLDRAGISRSPAEWALFGVCVSVILAAALTVLTSNLFVGVLVGAVAGWAGMRLLLSVKISRRCAAFDEQLPNVLQLIASSIQSGFSLAQAMDAVVREDAQPASGEFARALAETRIGVDLTDALEAVAVRMQSTDLHWVVMAVRIQRETGGNLAEVLRNTVATMRERAYLRRQVRTLSAEGRLSAYILLALPVLVGGWLFISDPSYMRPLYLTFLGLGMLIGALVLVVIGAIWMRNLIKVEV